MSNTGRWSLLALVAVVALIVALWPRGDDTADPNSDTDPSAMTAAPMGAAPNAADRAAAQLVPCPVAEAAPAPQAALAGVNLDCLADGRPVDLGAALAGRPALLNLWAYWCAPCAEELPYLEDYAARARGEVTVLTVHSDPDEAKALARLTDLGVHLPGVADGHTRVRAVAGAPNALPVSVLLRADGSIAEVVARPFRSVDDIAGVVERSLGVAA
ncbi:MAG: TlpA family protein disulfide reductase [Aldersonia sp.]|nr:TlpA family protein disulfide reductase [Aldersonia sp.]